MIPNLVYGIRLSGRQPLPGIAAAAQVSVKNQITLI
jgi:hypothetical protein